ncbi:GGDEF/EAL-containing response regulator [Leptospira interrogans]|uniref:Cyclic diguanylate phosphodiesterase (EAL) domain protein n=1 Tax=Leptospira interrogans serovar Zanoni str. LT2156 TaxID=1001601 RepID=M6HJM5_LEPIR|nr:REC domain-containing phosphodiesterase [Leptospira interrogans]EMM97335.1 cyclic diguanylate phosphodiesterase (EAL) domain protein [Leptospira interrogans serovar Zanoni str. LT2156]EMN67108.1 cyclic diguanylate phosphodiesterase (EAL) domain protein [Leptospira interrogans serovar Grippotyphosa str. UI 08434]EMO92520.1 cyclic diguanylate phosphodiesterase (EAL) domain protein [Leptospira interrogans str. UI 13372]MBM2887529.1 EAL domain-containing protein [Leptospira interrogans]MCR86472
MDGNINSQEENKDSRPIILLVDDEPIILRGLKEQLKLAFGKDYDIEIAEDAEAAWEILEEYVEKGIDIPVVVCDQVMPGVKGDELLIRIHNKKPDIRKIMLTGQASADAVGNALNHANLYRYLSKPWDSNDLILTIREALKSYFSDLSLVELNRKLETTLLYNRETGRPNFESLRKILEEREAKEAQSTLAVIRIESSTATTHHFGVGVYHKVLNQLLAALSSFMGDSGSLFHLYQDEVAVLSNVDEDRFHSLLVAFRILLRSEYIQADGVAFRVNVSIGVATHQHSLYYKARIAMMHAAQNVELELMNYSQAMEEGDQYQINLILGRKLNDAIHVGNVIPYFQGIYDNTLEKITKFECLARIQDGDRVYSPASFISIARSTGIIRLLTPIMIEKSIRYFAQYPEYSFSVNISESDLEKKGFASWVISRLEHYNIVPERFTLEILETDRLRGGERGLETLKELKESGCKIAIDDFGVDQSNFERLMEIDPDFIKIDGKFIQGIHLSRTPYLLTSAMTEMAHRIGAKVIAEFVAGKGEFDTVRSLGVEYCQGYYIMQPVPEIFPIPQVSV